LSCGPSIPCAGSPSSRGRSRPSWELTQDITSDYEQILLFQGVVVVTCLLSSVIMFALLLMLIQRAERVLADRMAKNRQLENELHSNEKLVSMGRVIASIAHEIRNPLFAIGGFANSLLRLPTLDETARGKVQVILEESRRLDNILRSILNFARPTTSKAGKADLNGVVRQTLELMAFGFDTRRITSELALAADLPRVRGDAELIKQCLINLVKNAQEAMPGGGVLTVRTGMTHSHVFVTVEDSGEGIPAEMHERIFSPFFSTKEKGAGIGLAMTRKIVEDMGGKVDLVSHVGKGTRITLFLPPVLAVPEGETPPHANGPAGEDTPGETGGQGSPSSRDAQTSETATSGTPPPPETASAPASSATSPCPFARKD